MSELLSAILGFPTIIFTVMLVVVLVYWLFVILGALDIDLFHGHADGAFEGSTKAALEGGLKGALEGSFKGAAEGVAAGVDGGVHGAGHGVGHGVGDGAGDGLADGLADGGADGAEGTTNILSALRLRDAPVTVVTSFVTLYGWLLSFFGMRYLGPALPFPSWLTGLGVLLLSFVAAVLLTSVTVRPIGRYFVTESGKHRADFVGSICTVQTGEVTESFGQATVDDGGAGLIVQVRSTKGRLDVERGARALIIDYDEAIEAYVVEPYDDMLRVRSPEATQPAAAEGETTSDEPMEEERKAKR